MNLNTLAYLIYIPITTFITLRVGYVLYKNGEPFILKQLKGDKELTHFINKILLAGYYLLNLGYCFWIIADWNDLMTHAEVIESLAETIGTIVLGLGIMHFFNIIILQLIGKNKTTIINHIKH